MVRKKTSNQRQKAKVNWAMEIVIRIFFHHWLYGRSKIFIDPLENDRGDTVKGEKEVEEEILSFFSNIYGLEVEPKLFFKVWSGVLFQSLRSWSRPYSLWKKLGK